jgi:hypothetical protein
MGLEAVPYITVLNTLVRFEVKERSNKVLTLAQGIVIQLIALFPVIRRICKVLPFSTGTTNISHLSRGQ